MPSGIPAARQRSHIILEPSSAEGDDSRGRSGDRRLAGATGHADLAGADDRLERQWHLPDTIRERIDAIAALPTGTVRKEPVAMRIAGLLHAGERDEELPRLAARVGLRSLESVGG